MDLFVSAVIQGVLLGGLFAIIGVGLSLVFGIMGLTNIAHGDIMILASFFIMVFSVQMGINLFVALAITIVVMVVIGAAMQKFLINRVITKGAEPALLVTFGISIIIQNILTLIFNADSRIIKGPFSDVNVVSTNWVSISAEYLMNCLVAVGVIIALSLVMKKTYLGRSIRAASSNVTAAEFMGVNTLKTYVYAMCIAVVTSCVAGLLVGQTFVFYPYSGTQYLIIAFGVVVIGGMGSIVGTLLGGLILGVSQLLGALFFGNGYMILIGYIVMLVLLTFRPRGLLSNMARK
ncbi:MAG: branched-chain amino acid ABC transporter permease [Clostridiales bacterium]|nr:branched-chain amino acid ABC transporter permease [Clostridiales bacterium]